MHTAFPCHVPPGLPTQPGGLQVQPALLWGRGGGLLCNLRVPRLITQRLQGCAAPRAGRGPGKAAPGVPHQMGLTYWSRMKLSPELCTAETELQGVSHRIHPPHSGLITRLGALHRAKSTAIPNKASSLPIKALCSFTLRRVGGKKRLARCGQGDGRSQLAPSSLGIVHAGIWTLPGATLPWGR